MTLRRLLEAADIGAKLCRKAAICQGCEKPMGGAATQKPLGAAHMQMKLCNAASDLATVVLR